MNSIEIKKLNKKYAKFALEDVSFNLPSGSIMGFIGENGSGKTTTLKCILDILKKYTGEIKIFNLDNKDINLKEDIGVVLDEAFFPDILKPKDINKIMQGIYKTWDEDLFKQYLKKFSLEYTKEIKTFSMGMKKKLEIATMLAHKSKLLILDEPTSGLDPIARQEIMDIFQEFIEDENCSILFSTHITSDLELIADYITFINDGKIVLSKTKDELLEQFGLVKCTKEEFSKIAKQDYLRYLKNKYDYQILVTDKKRFKNKYPKVVVDKINLEQIMLLMIKGGN